MKRLFSTIFAFALMSMLVYAQREQPTSVFMQLKDKDGKVATTSDDGSIITIDGVDDEVAWLDANAPSNNIAIPFTAGTTLETPTLGSEGQTWWKALWSEKGVYIFVNVTDDAWNPDYLGGGNSWENDKIEIYFDVNYLLADGIGSSSNNGHYQIAPGAAQAKEDGTPSKQADGVVYSIKVSGTNWTGEYFIPWDKLKNIDGESVSLAAETEIGFDVTVIDRDPGDPGRKRANWANDGLTVFGYASSTPNENYGNMDGAGLVTLDGTVTYVDLDKITITGDNTITTNNGTIQFSANFLPENATDKNPIWKMEAVDGKASISANGLLTGLGNGKVKVWAESTDGFVSSNLIEVTISNQLATDVEIVNADFGLPEDGNKYYTLSSNAIPGWNSDDAINDDNGREPSYKAYLKNTGGSIYNVLSEVIPSTKTTYKLSCDANLIWNSESSSTLYYIIIFAALNNADPTTRVEIQRDTIEATFNGEISSTLEIQASDYYAGSQLVVEFDFGCNSETNDNSWVGVDNFALTKTPGSLSSIKSIDNVNVNVYPNPVSSNLQVESSEIVKNVSIYSLSGQKIKEFNINSFKSTINLAKLVKGMYLLNIETESGIKTLKITK